MATSPTNQDIYDENRKRNLYTANMYNSQQANTASAQQMYAASGALPANARASGAIVTTPTSTPYTAALSSASRPATTSSVASAAANKDASTDYSVLLRDAMDAGADADTVQRLLDARVAKATSDPALNKYAFDDVYKSSIDYINSSKLKSSSMTPSLNAPQRTDDYYEPNYRAVLEEARNYQPFSYNVESDPAYQAYAKAYRREGDRAAQNALAGAAGMTGGIPSSYAVGAATQAGNYYASQLSDKIPELYQQAYNRYLQEYSRRLGLADYYRQGASDAEDRYLSDVNRYNTDRNFAYGAYRDELADAQNKEQTDYARAIYAQEYADQLAAAQAKAAYQQQQDDLDHAKWLAEFDADQSNKAFANAIKIADTLGYVPELYAGILGVPAGTSTADASYKALKAKDTGGGGDDRVYDIGNDRGDDGGDEKSPLYTVRYNFNTSPDPKYTNATATSLDYDENTGIFHWNGTDFRRPEDLEMALAHSFEDGYINEDDLKEIFRKLKMYGFDVAADKDKE